MELHEFIIGKTFNTATGEWFVLDVGTKTVLAVPVEFRDRFLSKGGVEEELYSHATVFDSLDFGGCWI